MIVLYWLDQLPRVPDDVQRAAKAAALPLAMLVLGLVLGRSWEWLTAQYMLHSHCYGADPWIGVPYVGGHLLTALAYLAIPAQIIGAHRRHPEAIPAWAAWGFAAFIAACGVGHLLEVASHVVWAAYRINAWWGFLVTAPLSVGTAWYAGRARRAAEETIATADQAMELAGLAEAADEARKLAEAARALRGQGQELSAEAVDALHDLSELVAFRGLLEEMGLLLIGTDGTRIVDANPPLVALLGEDPRGLTVAEYLDAFTTPEMVAPTQDYHDVAANHGVTQTRYELALGPRGGHRTAVVWHSSSNPERPRTYGIGYVHDL